MERGRKRVRRCRRSSQMTGAAQMMLFSPVCQIDAAMRILVDSFVETVTGRGHSRGVNRPMRNALSLFAWR